MATSYKDMMIANAPAWLRQPQGTALQRGLGDVKDSVLERTKESVKARFPLYAPPDALVALGVERQLPKAKGESYATYALRLQAAWTVWPWAGTAYGVLYALKSSGYPGFELYIAKGKRYTLDGAGELVVTDMNVGVVPAYWSAFFAYLPNASFPAAWSGTPPASSSDEAKFIIGLIKKWKSAHMRFDRVSLGMGGPVWGVMTWGSFTWGGPAPIVWEGPF
ncbi:MAG: hypothetical protein ABW123_11620 [Cystobacter sp.]